MPSSANALRRLVLSVSALSLGAVAPRAADAQKLAPLAWYTFSGCFDGAGCHTARIVVGDVIENPGASLFNPKLPGGKGMMFHIVHQLPAGVALDQPFPYQPFSPTGERRVFDDDDIYRGGVTCPALFSAPVPTTCEGGIGSFQGMPGSDVTDPFFVTLLAGWVSPDWRPTVFNVGITLGTPGTSMIHERRTLGLQLVSSTQVVPEPSTVALLGGGLAMLGALARRRLRAQSKR